MTMEQSQGTCLYKRGKLKVRLQQVLAICLVQLETNLVARSQSELKNLFTKFPW